MNTNQLLCCIIFLFNAEASWAGITTSFPVLTMIVSELVNPEEPSMAIRTLVHSGEEAHHFELSPKGLINLQKEKLLIVNGLQFEHWLDPVRAKIASKVKIVEAAEGIKPIRLSEKQIDPHAWHDPENLIIYVRNIEVALSEVYPHQKQFIRQQGEALRTKIQKWHAEKITEFKSLPLPFMIVTAHNSFAYFARAHGLKNLALLGDHEGETLSPRQLSTYLKEIRQAKHRLFLGDGNEQDTNLRGWAKKTSSPWGGELWGDTLPQRTPTLKTLEYLEHNTSVVIKSTR